MNDETNPVMNQIEALTGSSLADTVDAPKTESAPVNVDEPQTEDLPESPNMADLQTAPVEEQQPVIEPVAEPIVSGQQTPDSLENAQDPVSYDRRRFQKVNPYIVTMPNGDQFKTDSLDKEKILYDYNAQLREANDPLAIRGSLSKHANKNYFGYVEVPEGIRESIAGAAGRGAVNTITSMPFDVYSASQVAALGLLQDNLNLTDEQKEFLAKNANENLDASSEYKNDLTAHASAYWVDSADTWQRNLGTGIGSVAASVVPAFMTSGASIGVNAAAKTALKTTTKAATKKLGKNATAEAAEGMAKRALNIRGLRREFMRDPKFDPTAARQSLAITYTNRIANAMNYGIAAGEASNATVDVYMDALGKTNDVNLAVGNALAAGGIVGVLGASPEWVHGAFGALTGASRKMWRAALAGDKARLRRMVAGDVLMSGGLEGLSEVGQDITVADFENKQVDPAEEFMTFALASIMAGTMTGVSNRNMPSKAVASATEFKQTLRDALKARAKIFNASMPGSSEIIRDEDIDKLMEIVDDPNFNTLAQKIVKKGILENVNKMNNMSDEDKRKLTDILNNPNLDASTEAFSDFDKRLDDEVLAGVNDLTPAQKAIFKSIMHGVARFGILSGQLSSPIELLSRFNAGDFTTGGLESYTENGGANIATEGNTHLQRYNAGKANVAPDANEAMQTSAQVNNQIQKSATKGMTQGSVDILHEVLGHLFASDVIANGDLPHFLIRYTQLLQEAIAEVMPNAEINEDTPVEMLDEYRAYAMANSSKIAEMLGFKGDTAKLFSFFEQMALADRANFGAIKTYVDTLRAILEENSDAIRGLIDNYGDELPAAIKHYADTGEVGVLTNDDLKALSRVLKTGLADADTKVDLMSVFGDKGTFETLTDRLGKRFDIAVEKDRQDAQLVYDEEIRQAKEDVENAPDAPVNEEAVETLDELQKQAEQTEEQTEEQAEKPAQEMVNNQVTFDGKKYYYLTKAPIAMPNPEAVKEVQHTKEEGEPEAIDKETYRASQLATTGLTKTELEKFTNYALSEIKKNAPDVFDELIKKIDQEVDANKGKIIHIPLHDAQDRLSGYMFKYAGEFQVGSSKLRFDEKTSFTNRGSSKRSAALSSDIAYYIMAKRAAKADNRRYSVRVINSALEGYRKQLEESGQFNPELDNVAAQLVSLEDQYQAFTADQESNTREYKQLLEQLRDVAPNFKFRLPTARTSVAAQEDLMEAGDWYSAFYDKVSGAKDVAFAKKTIKNSLALSKEATAELDGLKTQDEIMNFVHAHSNDFKYIRKQTKTVDEDVMFRDYLDQELDSLEQDENAESRDISSWYAPGKKLTSAQKKQIAKARKADLPGPERAKAIEEFLKSRTDLHTTKDESSLDIFTGTKIKTFREDGYVGYEFVDNPESYQLPPEDTSVPGEDAKTVPAKVNEYFKKSGYKSYTPLTNYKAQVGYAAQNAEYNQEGEGDMQVRGALPEDYGFNNRANMDAVFEAYNVPRVNFDVDAYLNAPKTGKLNKSKTYKLNEFLEDFADMATKQVNEMVGKNVLSAKDRLTYVRAVIDADEAGRRAYDIYSKNLQDAMVKAGYRLSTANQLLNPEGYQNFASKEQISKNDINLKDSLLFEEFDKGLFDNYVAYDNEYEPQMFPVNNTKFLTPGRIVRFPYGMNSRIGMIAVQANISQDSASPARNKMFLFRTAMLDSKGKIKYEEFYIPRSDFEEMLQDGDKQIMVSDGVFDEMGRARFNSAFNEKLKEQKASKGYEMHSGGAVGSDSVWGTEAQKYGVNVNHYYAQGNKTPAGNREVPQETLDAAKQHVELANKTLKRNISNISKNTLGLLERNYEQVKHSDAVFAVGVFKGDQVDGGTGWAVQMAIDEGKPVYVFDQNQQKWFAYNKSTKNFEEFGDTPVLTKNFAGIGTRKINEAGKKAIADVLENTFGQSKFTKAVDTMELARERSFMPGANEGPATLLERIEGTMNDKGRRYTSRPTVSQNMADLLKSMTPADSEYDSDLTETELAYYKAKDAQTAAQRIMFKRFKPGETVTQEDFQNAFAAEQFLKEQSMQSVSDFADSPFMGNQNIIDYVNGLTQKANDSRSSKLIHKVPLFLGSMSGTDRLYRMIFGGDDPLSMSLAESAQIMTYESEKATEELQRVIASTLKDKGGAQSFNEFFRNRLTNSPVQAELYNGKKVDIRRGEIQTLYAAWVIENSIVNGKYKFEQSAIDGGNNMYSRLKKTMYKNADELIGVGEFEGKGVLTQEEKDVVDAMLDFFKKTTNAEGKRFVLSLGSYTKSTQNDWSLRQQYFTRATKAEMTDMHSLLLAGDLFDTLNNDFKANAIYNSGVKKNLTTMKNMLLFGLNYSNAADGLSGYERFLKDFKLRGDANEDSEDFQKFTQMLEASNNLREAVRETLGKFGFERFMKRLEQEERKPETAFKLLPTGLGKWVERFTRASMASKLAFKPKNALQNFMGAWQRLCPLSDSTGRWYTTDLLDAMINIKEVLKQAEENAFVMQRYSRNALGEEYQKVTDVSSTESALAELSIWAKNAKKTGNTSLSSILGKLDDFAKKMTKISVGYGTSGADFLALAMGWYKLKPSLVQQAREINRNNTGSGKAVVSAETLFMNHVLRNISSSNFMTRSPVQNWAIRNHMGALTAFLNDSLQSYGAIGESWYNYHNAKTDAERRYYRRVITSNIASQMFYVATQIGAFSALYGWVATDDGLTDAEQEYLWDALLRETVGQISSMTPLDQFTRPVLEAAVFNEKRQGGNVLVSIFQDLGSDINKGDWVGLMSDMGDLSGFAGTRRAIDVADALWSAYSKDDQRYRMTGEVLFGRTQNTAMKIQGLRKNSKGEIVEKKKKE